MMVADNAVVDALVQLKRSASVQDRRGLQDFALTEVERFDDDIAAIPGFDRAIGIPIDGGVKHGAAVEVTIG